MKKINSFLLLLLGIFIVSSCKKDDNTSIPDIEKAKGFYIVNEGFFTNGNASLSFYDYEKDSVINNLFENKNNRPLGDVFQSMTFHNGKAYLVINNSKKIEVADSLTMTSIKTLDLGAGSSPRNLLFLGSKAYLTDLYSNKIQVLDADNLNKIGSISVEGSTEKMAVFNNKILVTVNQSNGYTEESLQGLLVINPAADTIETYLKLSEGAVDVKVDYQNNIWVYCTGDWANENANAKLYKVNGNNLSVSQTFNFVGTSFYNSPLKLNQAKNILFTAVANPNNPYSQYDIFEVPVNSTAFPSAPYYSNSDYFINGYDVNLDKNELYILNADYSQAGNLIILNADTKAEKRRFDVGYLPSQIYIR
ncbi:MAG: hypothetical protein M9887_00650 [Chitinophagales bacterium]|nr:hypothetical protein [Chitinophagales bacterium]